MIVPIRRTTALSCVGGSAPLLWWTTLFPEKEIARAVTTAFDYLLRPEERVMTNLYKSCFSPTGNMRRELFKWVNPDQYGNIFNATNDSLDLKSKRFMAFDFTHIFEDEVLAPAVISYIACIVSSRKPAKPGFPL
ncbi:MAG: hypothetical protein ACLU99_01890 [Alphaproteobacteria bacterium]